MTGVTEAELEIVGTKGSKLYEDDDEDKGSLRTQRPLKVPTSLD